MKFSTLLSLLILVGIVGCGQDNSGKTKPKNPTRVDSQSASEENAESSEHNSINVSKRRKVSLNKDFSPSEFSEFKENLNTYLVTLEAKSGDYLGAQVECRVSSHLIPLEDKTIASFDRTGLRAEVELTLEADGPLSVDFLCRVIERGVEVDAVTVNLKKSVLVSKKQNIYALGLAGKQNIEALVLDDGAVLTTEGSILELHMNELISNRGVIATFARDGMPIPVENEPGKSGGVISITTGNAIGDITFELRGTDAGAQTKVPEKNPYIHPKDIRLNGQCRGRVEASKFSKNDQRCWGKQGAQGKPGLKGARGFDGGSTGLVVLKAEFETEFRWGVSYFPGKESEGGIGGEGGVGGEGGTGSTVEVYRAHADQNTGGSHIKSASTFEGNYTYPKGRNGEPGITGERGDSGKPGEKLNSQIIMGSQEDKYKFNFDYKNY